MSVVRIGRKREQFFFLKRWGLELFEQKGGGHESCMDLFVCFSPLSPLLSLLFVLRLVLDLTTQCERTVFETVGLKDGRASGVG